MTDDLLKFVKKGDDVCKFIESFLDREKNARNIIYGSGIDPEEITQCPRRLIYKTQNTKPKNFNTRWITELKTKEKWIEYLRTAREGILVIESELPLSDCNFGIEGKIDVVASIFKDRKYVIQIHALSNKDFLTVQNKGVIKKHVMAMQIYLWQTELDDGLLIYENKNNQNYQVFHIEKYLPIIGSIKDKLSRLRKSKLIDNLPSRPYESSAAKECSNCEFIKECW